MVKHTTHTKTHKMIPNSNKIKTNKSGVKGVQKPRKTNKKGTSKQNNKRTHKKKNTTVVQGTLNNALIENIIHKIQQSEQDEFDPNEDLAEIRKSIEQYPLPSCWVELSNYSEEKTVFFRYTVESLGIKLSEKQTIYFQESNLFKFCMDHLTILADKNTKKTEKKTLSPEECTSQFCNSPSEMACSASYCQPLFEFCALFDNCYRNIDIQEPWYKDIATIGITTDKEKANVYAVSTDIATTRRRNCKLDYSIRYLGTFYHNQITHRIQLIALILTAMKNLHHQEMVAYLRTKSVTSNSTIGSAEKSFKKNLEVRIGRNCYNISIGKTISDNKNKLVKMGNLKLGPNEELEIILKRCTFTEKYNTDIASQEMRTLYFSISSEDHYILSLKGTPLPFNLSIEELITMTCHILCQISILESNGLIHNDVKQGNIVIHTVITFLLILKYPSNLPSIMIILHQEDNASLMNYLQQLKSKLENHLPFYNVVNNLLKKDPKKRHFPSQLLDYLTKESEIDEKDVRTYFEQTTGFTNRYFHPHDDRNITVNLEKDVFANVVDDE